MYDPDMNARECYVLTLYVFGANDDADWSDREDGDDGADGAHGDVEDDSADVGDGDVG